MKVWLLGYMFGLISVMDPSTPILFTVVEAEGLTLEQCLETAKKGEQAWRADPVGNVTIRLHCVESEEQPGPDYPLPD
jgi:hypothetical protein